MGIMLLVLVPVPYVDASAADGVSRASGGASSSARAGMMVELVARRARARSSGSAPSPAWCARSPST